MENEEELSKSDKEFLEMMGELSESDKKRLAEMEQTLGTRIEKTGIRSQKSIRSENKKAHSKIKRLSGLKKIIKTMPIRKTGRRLNLKLRQPSKSKYSDDSFDIALSKAICKDFGGKEEIQTLMERQFFNTQNQGDRNLLGDQKNKDLLGHGTLNNDKKIRRLI